MLVANTTPYRLGFKSESTIYQTQIRCKINENELNLSLNPSMTNYSGSLKDNVTGSYFHPYVTTVGLYNERNELVAVAKTAQPTPIPSNTDITFLIRYDT